MKKAWAGCLLALILLFTGCSTKYEMAESSSMAVADGGVAGGTMNNATSAEFAQDTAAADNGGEADIWANNNAKIIRTVEMEVETTEFDRFISDIRQNTETSGGYVENSSVSGTRMGQDGARQERNGSLTLRIPKEKLDHFISGVSQKGNVIYQNEYTDDITLQYYDTESRVKALEIEQERLLALLEKADDIEAIIRLEERLTEVRRQLEGHASSIKQYDNLVDYATLTLYINEVKNITEQKGEGMAVQMGQGILHSLKNIGAFCKEAAIFVVVNLPYLLLIAVIVIVLWMLIRHHKKKRRALTEQAHLSKKEPADDISDDKPNQ